MTFNPIMPLREIAINSFISIFQENTATINEPLFVYLKNSNF